MGCVLTKTVKKSSRVVVERNYPKITLDFHTNKKILEEIAIIPSKRLRNTASYSTHLIKCIQKGPVRGIVLKLQEEERDRCMDFVPDEFAIRTDVTEVDKETIEMLVALGMGDLPGIVKAPEAVVGLTTEAAKELKIYSLGSTSGIRAYGEYDLWLMRIEQYFFMTDYSIWKVIKNGNKVLTKTIRIVEQPYKPTSVKEKLDRKNEIKVGGTLLMALLNKDQLKFHSYQDAKFLMEAIEKRYGGNKESKKVQRTLLKQQYKNFVASSIKILDQTFDRLKKLISQLEIQGSSSTSQNLQNVAFISSNGTNSISITNKADNTAYGVSTAHTQEYLEQIDTDNLKEIDLHWEMAMLTIRARRFVKRTCRNLDINGQKIRVDRSKVECFNCHKNRHFARECKAPKNQENRGRQYSRKIVPVENPTKNGLIVQDGFRGYDWSYQAKEEHPTNYALIALTSLESSSSSDFEKLEKVKKEGDELKLKLEKFQNSSKSLNNLLESQVSDKVKTRLGYKADSPAEESFVKSSKMLENHENVKSRLDKGYHEVPPPYRGNYIPPKPDLMFIDEQVESKCVDIVSNVTSSDVKTVESKDESVDVKNKDV
uniref:40S ribosomal protein S17 n=1 Tax=Tanacetum cinerariifolium TaxID=118510 RepID=A0A6L2LFA5_TANCI|nr:40S ribosomal protein S17 [Tanacetum cinerariifolium]